MKQSLDFLRELEKNNNREWFDVHRKLYEQSKAELTTTTEDLIHRIGLFDPAIASLSPKDCIFRIYRDTRFSKNKVPYKNNVGASFTDGGKKSPKAGYYLHIQPGASFLAGGIWMPEAPVLHAIRQEVYFNHAALNRILDDPGFKKTFGQLEDHQLKTTPKGYDKEHPAIELLRYKSYVVSHSLSDKEIASSQLTEKAAGIFQEMYPLIQYLNAAVSLAGA
jgi:uncharacterized protein (TIGR02453 family)